MVHFEINILILITLFIMMTHALALVAAALFRSLSAFGLPYKYVRLCSNC